MENSSDSFMCMEDVHALRALARQFAAESAAQKAAALTRLRQMDVTDAQVLVAYHDALLFLLAYPQNLRIHQTCERELLRVGELTCQIIAAADSLPDALHGSGLPWTRIAVTFNYQVSTWLAHNFPESARLHAVRGDVATLRAWLGLAFPAVEFESLAHGAQNCDELLTHLGAYASAHPLRWLLDSLARVPCPEALRRRTHRELRVFVAIESANGALTRSHLRGLTRPLYCHKEALARREDVQTLLDTPLPAALELVASDRQQLLTSARGLLALLGRQTDPISDCNGKGVSAFDLGRGVVIALYFAAPAERAPLDSHVGMMLFKNGMPIAYGGGWPFLGVCKIGINIFEPYRGGESHFLFLSVMRAYRHLFGVERFIVERYQFGRNNPEGIASAAYWFYYRLGFRSMRTELAQLAETEWAKLRSEAGYTSPKEILEQFTEVHMELRLNGCAPGYDYCDPADLSRAVTAHVKKHYQGDRPAFMRWAQRRVAKALELPSSLSQSEKHAFAALSPVLALIPDLPRWSLADRALCKRWLLSKARDDELLYFDLLRSHPRLRGALEALGG